MTENETKMKYQKDILKYYLIGFFIIVFLFLFIINLILKFPLYILLIEITIIVSSVGGMGICFGICYLKSKSGAEYPKPKRDPTTIFKEERPKFKIYKTKYKSFRDKKEKKLIGFLEGNVVYNKTHKYLKGYYDDRDPREIEFIWDDKVIMRMRGDNLYRTKEGKKIASFKDLSMSTSTWREINAYIEPNEKMSKADIMMKTKRGPEKIGEIEGNVRKLNTQRACAIYGFLFEFFA